MELLLWTQPITTAASGNSNSVYETISEEAAVAKTAAATSEILYLCTSFKAGTNGKQNATGKTNGYIISDQITGDV